MEKSKEIVEENSISKVSKINERGVYELYFRRNQQKSKEIDKEGKQNDVDLGAWVIQTFVFLFI